MQEQERWLSVEEIAAHLGINRDTVYKWIDRKRMPAHKVGRLWKFKVSQVDEWIQAGKAGHDPTGSNQGMLSEESPISEQKANHA